MKHARDDYNRIQDPDGLIPEDEPVFLLRAQDVYAATIVDLYAQIVANCGGSLTISRLAREQAERMRSWPKKKGPDL